MIYILRSDGAYVSFQGMDLATIGIMIANLNMTFSQITQQQFAVATAQTFQTFQNTNAASVKNAGVAPQ